METTKKLLDNLTTTYARYNKLQEVFNEFCAQIVNACKGDGRLSIFTTKKYENKLTTKFLDRNIEFKYFFSVDDKENRKGCIRCQLVSSTPDKEPVVIYEFGFNGGGTANITSNDNKDPYIINDYDDAINIFLNCLALSVRENT